jgi:hypothetical protein
MPGPSTPAQIANYSLSLINQRSIATLTDANENARKCSLWYDTCRRDALRGCDWTFARTVTKLDLIGSWGEDQSFPFWAQPGQPFVNTITGNISVNGGSVGPITCGVLATLTISGTWVGTISILVSTNGGLSWISLASYITNQNAIAVNTNSSYCVVQVQSSNWTSGTATITLQGSEVTTISNSPTAYNAIPQWNFLYRYPGSVAAPQQGPNPFSNANGGCLFIHEVFNPRHAIIPSPYYDRSYGLHNRHRKKARYEVVRSRGTNELGIATNLDHAWVKYTQDISDSSQFDETFVQALALYLAQKIVMPLTGDKELAQMIDQQLMSKMTEAKRLNLTEQPEQLPKATELEDCRDFF